MQLGWIDFSRQDRTDAINVINSMKEKGVLDELGFGPLRQAFANCFFPGTSTIQTRAKYFFIVPYILQDFILNSSASENDFQKFISYSQNKISGNGGLENRVGKLLVETDVVTGNNDGEHDTPKGVWYVLYKDSPATLVGENDEYRTEVTYWMPITYGGVGIHDSSWRGSGEYGGDTYTYNGSHGCINTPYDKVEKIYKNLDAGTPVIVY